MWLVTNKKVHAVDGRTVKHLLPLDIEKLVQDFPYLAGWPVKSFINAIPRLLIGLNNSSLCVYDNIKEGKFSEPVAIRTRLGWLIDGAMRNKFIEHHHCHVEECSNKILFDLMRKFYTMMP